eukprot:m51a1_g5328 putative fascin subfamily protein (200) ;mRNA; f:379268-379927
MDFASCGGYLQDLTAPLSAGMVATVSHWGDGTMDWLDGKWCHAGCDKSGRLVVSDIELTGSDSTSGSAPAPEVPALAGQVHLKTFFNTFLSAQPNGQLVGDRAQANQWETFTVEKARLAGGVYLRSAHGKYVSANPQTGHVRADAAWANEWETFFAEARGDGQWVFRTTSGRYLTVEDKPHNVTAWNTVAQGWETFTVA